MRVLTQLEKNEFEKTYAFLECYIGAAAHSAKKVSQIKFDGKSANAELLKFIGGFNNLHEVSELNLVFPHNYTELQKVNLMFNNINANHKEKVMNRLIAYCFNNRVQPHRLRMYGFKNYMIVKDEAPVIVEYGKAA